MPRKRKNEESEIKTTKTRSGKKSKVQKVQEPEIIPAPVSEPVPERVHNGFMCQKCNKIVVHPDEHAKGHKEEMLNQEPVQYPLQVIFLEYRNGVVVGRKVM